MNIRKVCVVTGTRAEYGLFYPILKKIQASTQLELQLIVSTMKYVDLLIGNTSSGIIEAASFQKPVVNIGDRQKGRLQSCNVIVDVLSDVELSVIKKFVNIGTQI